MRYRLGALIVLASAALGSCRYGDPSDLFLTHRLTWFSYVAGEDLAAGCGAGQGERIRIVYNAVYGREVRAYDIVAVAGGAELGAQLLTPAYINEIALSPPYGPLNVLGPHRQSRHLDGRERDTLVDALGASHAFTRLAPGTELHSTEYYWTVAACRDGIFTIQAYVHPKVDFATLPFIVALRAVDPIAAPLPVPGQVTIFPGRGASGPVESAAADDRFYFVLVAGRDGMLRAR